MESHSKSFLKPDLHELMIDRLVDRYRKLEAEFKWVDSNRDSYSLDHITRLYHSKKMQFLFMYEQIPDNVLKEINEALIVKINPSKLTHLKNQFTQWIYRLIK